MSGVLVRGPWSSSPVVQPLGRTRKGEWFKRHPDGRLVIVREGVFLGVAPVAEARVNPGYPQPNRPPNRTRITQALDLRGMYGPEVDEALGVEEPTVDHWESGELIPTPGDVRRLATLTDFQVHFFYGETIAIDGPMFMCGDDVLNPAARTEEQ